jgi:hypothetical protein
MAAAGALLFEMLMFGLVQHKSEAVVPLYTSESVEWWWPRALSYGWCGSSTTFC